MLIGWDGLLENRENLTSITIAYQLERNRTATTSLDPDEILTFRRDPIGGVRSLPNPVHG
jgi:hypothetical protein